MFEPESRAVKLADFGSAKVWRENFDQRLDRKLGKIPVDCWEQKEQGNLKCEGKSYIYILYIYIYICLIYLNYLKYI